MDKDTVAAELMADLAPLGNLTSKRMFGGVGVFHDGRMFILVDADGRAFLRADDETSAAFEAEGSVRHRPMPYWAIPDTVLASEALLLEWARTAVAVAHAAKK